MKLRPAIKFDKGNASNVKKINDDAMSVNCDVIVFFPIYGKFVAIWKSDSECMVCTKAKTRT